MMSQTMDALAGPESCRCGFSHSLRSVTRSSLRTSKRRSPFWATNVDVPNRLESSSNAAWPVSEFDPRPAARFFRALVKKLGCGQVLDREAQRLEEGNFLGCAPPGAHPCQ